MIVSVSTQPPRSARGPDTGMPRMLRAAKLDPDVRRLMRQLSLYPVRPTSAYSLERARRDWQLAIKAFGSREDVLSVFERRIGGPAGELRMRIYAPKSDRERRRPVLVWFHGGGFLLGDLYTAGGTCRALANRSGAIVVAVQYRLAPEYDLHAGHEDCLAAVRWLAEHAGEIGGDRKRLAVGGDSAGGALAARVAQRAVGLGLPLALQVLVYPATDLAGDYPSHDENDIGYLLTSEHMSWMNRHISGVSDIEDPDLSPLLCPDLSGVAPALVVTAGFDPLRDPGLAYVARLREAATGVQSLHYADHVHGFMSFDRVLRGGRDVLDRIGGAAASVFAMGAFEPGIDGVYVDNRPSWLRAPGATVRQRWNEARVGQLLAAEWAQAGGSRVAARTRKLIPSLDRRPRR